MLLTEKNNVRSFVNEYGWEEQYERFSVDHFRSGHIDRDADCGTCDGARCEHCRELWQVFETEYDEVRQQLVNTGWRNFTSEAAAEEYVTKQLTLASQPIEHRFVWSCDVYVEVNEYDDAGKYVGAKSTTWTETGFAEELEAALDAMRAEQKHIESWYEDDEYYCLVNSSINFECVVPIPQDTEFTAADSPEFVYHELTH